MTDRRSELRHLGLLFLFKSMQFGHKDPKKQTQGMANTGTGHVAMPAVKRMSAVSVPSSRQEGVIRHREHDAPSNQWIPSEILTKKPHPILHNRGSVGLLAVVWSCPLMVSDARACEKLARVVFCS
jgi:hypothetical protein